MVALTQAWPLMAPGDGTVGMNNDRDFRMLLASLLQPDAVTGDTMAVRSGVLPHQWDDANSVTTLRVQQRATAEMAVDVLGGPYVVVREGQGPYLGWAQESVRVPIATADDSNPRIDTVYAWVGDQLNFEDIDPVHGPVVDVVPGVAHNPPSPNTDDLPDGAEVLSYVTVGAKVNKILDTNIQRARHSTCLTGGTRYLLEGDSITDPGRVDGEKRRRQAASPLPALEDFWDAVQEKWRGTTPITFSAAFPGASGSTSGSARLTVISFAVPDPGWPYKVETSGTVRITGGTCNLYCSVNNGPFSSAITSFLSGDPGGSRYLVPTDSGVLTGNSTVRLNIDPLAPFVPVTWSTDTRNKLMIKVVPV